MGKNPVVSVVIPTLNRAHLLVPTLESILSQNYPHIECIVKDGGSTDGTVEILKSYGDRIRWVSEPDDSHTDAINKGMWMSTGDILAWLNADDKYATPDTVGKAVEYLKDNPHLDVVYGDYAFINEDGEVISDVIQPREYDLIHAVKYCDHIIPQAASFMRRSILEKVNWLDPEFVNCKDHELWLRIAMVGTIKYAPFFGAYICQGKGLSQRNDVVEGKVNLTKKFFQQKNLPSPFNSKMFQKRALSNAYLAGGLFVWYGSKKLKTYLQFLLRALKIAPWNILYIIKQLLDHVFPFTTSNFITPILSIMVLSAFVCLSMWLERKYFGFPAVIFTYMAVLVLSLIFMYYKGLRFFYHKKWIVYRGIRDFSIITVLASIIGWQLWSKEKTIGPVSIAYLYLVVLVVSVVFVVYKMVMFVKRKKVHWQENVTKS